MPAPIYLDHAASSPVRREVLEAMLPFLGERFGNPSSAHRWGREARVALDEARARLAGCLGARADEICFTSGGTEADNFAVLGGWRARRAAGRRTVVSSPIEHKAVLGAVEQAQREGATARFADVTRDGVVAPEALAPLLDDSVAVCSVMWVNNEVGTVQPLPALAEQARSCGALVHTDAVQAFGKLPIDVATVPVDLLTISGHKIGAPKGVGAVYVRRGTTVEPIVHGGAQDRGRRAGTENVAFAVALSVAAELAVAEREREVARLTALRGALEAALLSRVPDAVIHGHTAPRAPHICNVSIPGTDSAALLMALDLRGIAASGGSACQSGSVGASHVLAAMRVPPDLVVAALRFSVGGLTTEACVARAAEVVATLVEKARRTTPTAG